MKREEKNALSQQRILEAAMEEFSRKGYEGASLSTACAEKGISKGIVYHHYKDKDELYLRCVQLCFDAVTAALRQTAQALEGPVEQRLRDYFDARLRFFGGHPLELGVFADAVFRPAPALRERIADCRREFDALNISVLTDLLDSGALRSGLSAAEIVEDFRLYMDVFNLRFRTALQEGRAVEEVLREHEIRCHRQIDILLFGVMGEHDEKTI